MPPPILSPKRRSSETTSWRRCSRSSGTAHLSLDVDEKLRLYSDGLDDVDSDGYESDTFGHERFDGENRACIGAFYERLHDEASSNNCAH